ncbi:MAG: amidase family protein, partial [bacterium]|nr:amidase family protein [bacterium]
GYIDAYYKKADASRAVLRQEYTDAFKKADVIAFPTTPSPAFKFGEKSDPLAMYLEDIFTVTANLTGMPAISIPMGTVDREGNKLPVGIHFTAPHQSEETRRRILLGTFVLSSGYIDAYYKKADASRAVLRQEYTDAFKKADVIAFPTTPSPAFKFGEKSDPLAMYLEDIFTVTANLTGMPAISIPMGFVEREKKQLPVGIHFTAPHQSEETLFSLRF